jgi:hypothetical protein
MPNVNHQRRKSQSTAKAEYERVVLDKMPVAERKRLRAVSMLTRKETKNSLRGSAVSALNPSATGGLAEVPKKVESPQLLYPSTFCAPVPKHVEVARSPTNAREPLSPLTCTPLVRYSSNEINQRQWRTRPSALIVDKSRANTEETGLTRDWFDLSKQRGAMRAKRQERVKIAAAKRVSLGEPRREDPTSKSGEQCGDELSFHG